MVDDPSMIPPSHFLTLSDWSGERVHHLIELARDLKNRFKTGDHSVKPLMGKTLAMIFHKASTRTRISFEIGTYQLGGHALMISAQSSQLGRGEPIEDSARVLSRYVDGVMIRTFEHESLTAWAASSAVPVINGLTDLYHPCQVLADLLTCQEHLEVGRAGLDSWSALDVAWIGDGNNMAHSWIEASRQLGFRLRLACPEGYDPAPEILESALTSGARIQLFRDPREAVEGALVVNTDVWASMGQEEEAHARMKAFAGYLVDEELMSLADDRGLFLHCLPAHRGEEVSGAVIDGPRSVVWDQAENRLHAQKALMARLIGGL